jgi:hypothetical protein
MSRGENLLRGKVTTNRGERYLSPLVVAEIPRSAAGRDTRSDAVPGGKSRPKDDEQHREDFHGGSHNRSKRINPENP